MDKFIVTAALTGAIHTPTMSPHLPITPDELAQEARRAYEAGAAVVHVHARNPETGQPSADSALFGEILAKIKDACDAVVCTTTGGGFGMTVEQRVAVVKTYSPELASLNAGSLNFALHPLLDKIRDFKHEWEPQYLAMSEDFIFPNTFKTLREFADFFAREDTKPEFEIYDVGMINNLSFLLNKAQIKKPVYLQFVLGILGGLPATVGNLVFLLNTARETFGDNFVWSVCAAGRAQLPMCTAALLMGGFTRVGLEDSLFLEKGKMAQSSAEQVEKVIRIARELGLEPATPDEARSILKLKGLDRINF
ncbi:MAG: 3-keto-5-aminohexanoate cleavage protein [Deltaproteobacteria bacterium]|nr:MAG: 3-keto-5-aminohexanoate cleavage protein [Deltaproteobacteria bacterium]